jgi:hypothetical protein
MGAVASAIKCVTGNYITVIYALLITGWIFWESCTATGAENALNSCNTY